MEGEADVFWREGNSYQGYIHSILVYAMSVFKMLKHICKGIILAISQFWWGDDNQQKHIHW